MAKKRKRLATTLQTEPPPPEKRIWREAIAAPNGALYDNGFHTYKVDPLDHAETDVRAYSHVAPLMRMLAKELGKSCSELGLWDPYFCKGAMVAKLASLGFPKVHNKNEDCYKVMASGKLPEHDIVLTAPPYSGDHMEKLMQFVMSPVQANKIWLLLLPNFVERKDFFDRHVGSQRSRLFFVAPVVRYTYEMPLELVGDMKPEWVGQDGGISPYDSTWYIHLPRHMDVNRFYQRLDSHRDHKKEWFLARTMKAIRWKMKKAGKVSGPLSSLAVPDGQSKPAKKDAPASKRKKKGKNLVQIKHIPGTVAFD